jgi:uncharacterized membrane-anchored protein YhcB (DUF1043 family)
VPAGVLIMENATKASEKSRIWRNIMIAVLAGILAAGIVMYKNSHKTQPTLKQQLQEKKTQDSLANQIK